MAPLGVGGLTGREMTHSPCHAQVVGWCRKSPCPLLMPFPCVLFTSSFEAAQTLQNVQSSLRLPRRGDTNAAGSHALSAGVHLLGTALLPCSCV